MENVPEIMPVKASVENAHTREKVEGALRSTFDRYKTAYDSGRLDSKPELKWKFVGAKAAYEKTLGKTPPETTYKNEFNNHPVDPPARYTQQEGIPVDGLMEFIQSELAALPADSPDREELEKQLKILDDESRSFAFSPERRHPGRLVGRVTQEASFIAQDAIMKPAIQERLRTTLGREPTQQEIDEANWYEGINVLTARRELVMPAPSAPLPPDAAPPTDDADDADAPRPAPVPPGGTGPTPPGGAPPPPPDAAPPPTGGSTPPEDGIENLRIEATIIDNTQSTAQRAQKEAQKSVDNRMREGAWWQFWRWPQKTWVRWTQPYQVESGRQRLMEAAARSGTSYVTMETATRAIPQLGTERAKEQEDRQNILRRFASGAITDQANARGERIVEVTNQALRQRMVAEVLRPIVESMRNGAPLTEDDVQKNLRTFVQNNLRTSPELQEFFGPNGNDFGELASSFATDLMDMGRQTNEAMIRYDKTLEELDQYIHIRLANARGFDTDQRGLIARWVANARRRESYRQAGLIEHAGGRAGVILNPLVVGVGTGLALQGIMMMGRKEAVVAGTALGGIPTLGISAVAGGLAAGIRRNSETWADYRRHLFERESGEGVVGPRGGGLGTRIGEAVNFLSGGSTRERLEGIRSNLRIATASQILEGGTTDVATGEQQRSVADLLASNDVQHIAGRIAEIQSRQQFGADNRIALISYTNAQQEISDLEIARYQLQQHLEALTADPATARTEIDRQQTLYDRQFTTSREQAERAFNRYRLGNSLKAGAFGSVTGLAGGLVSHELLNQIVQAAPQAADIPVIGGIFGKHEISPNGAVNVGPVPPNPGINRDILKQLYENPGNLKLPNGMELAVDGLTHHATIIDAQGQTLPLPPMNLAENGSIVIAGNPDLIPEDVKKLIGGWEIKPNEAPAYNFHNKLEQVIQSGQHEGLTHGNLEIDMNSADGGQMSMRVLRELGNPDSGIQVHGFARMENGQPVLDFDQSFNGNANYSEDDWKLLHDELQKDGWTLTPEEVPGKTIIEANRPLNWEKHEALLDHREWYDNNTRPSDLNELRMNTVKNGNAMEIRMDRMNADGSFSDMLDPRNLNVPQVVKDGRAGVAFSYPGEESKRALVAQVNTPRGLSLDPTDADPNSVIHLWNDKTNAYDLTMQRGEFSKMVMNHNAYQNLPDGYVETELNRRYDVWRVGKDDKFGTISTGVPKVVNGNTVWQSAATIRGTQVPQPITTPPHLIYHVAPPPAIEIIAPEPAAPPPPTYAFDPAYIPTAFVPRRPLPPLVPPPPTPEEPPVIPPYYYDNAFPPGARFIDILRRGPHSNTSNLPTYYNNSAVYVDREEGRKALAEVRQSLEKAQRVYLVLGGALGDSILSTAYIKGVQQALAKLGKNTPITVVVNGDYDTIFDGLAGHNIKIVKAPRDEGLKATLDKIAKASDKNPLIIDLEHHRSTNPTIHQTTHGSKQVTTISNALAAMVALYDNATDGPERYAHAVEELFSLPKGSIDPHQTKPTLVLPTNKGAIKANVERKFGIDTSKPQITIAVGGSRPGKRYGMDQWAEVIKELAAVDPNYQFNIIYEPGSPMVGYRKNDIETSLTRAGVLNRSKLVHGSLIEMASLLEGQKLVLSSDSGFAHVAGAIEQAPSVVTVFLPRDSSTARWVSSTKQIPVTIDAAREAALPDDGGIDQEDETKKWINQIPPQDVARAAIAELRRRP